MTPSGVAIPADDADMHQDVHEICAKYGAKLYAKPIGVPDDHPNVDHFLGAAYGRSRLIQDLRSWACSPGCFLGEAPCRGAVSERWAEEERLFEAFCKEKEITGIAKFGAWVGWAGKAGLLP